MTQGRGGVSNGAHQRTGVAASRDSQGGAEGDGERGEADTRCPNPGPAAPRAAFSAPPPSGPRTQRLPFAAQNRGGGQPVSQSGRAPDPVRSG